MSLIKKNKKAISKTAPKASKSGKHKKLWIGIASVLVICGLFYNSPDKSDDPVQLSEAHTTNIENSIVSELPVNDSASAIIIAPSNQQPDSQIDITENDDLSQNAEEEARAKEEAAAKAKAEEEARIQAENDAKAEAEAKAKQAAEEKAAAEAKAKKEAAAKAEAEAKAKKEAAAKAEAEKKAAVAKAEREKKDTKKATYIGNKNTKKFHRPDCSSVTDMKASNMVFFYGNRNEPINAGYTPCKRCNP